jgi:AAA+ superfamily predicted ATPase
MVNQRPTLPVGYSVSGTLVVEKALHTDECRELYEVASTKDGWTSIVFLGLGATSEGSHLISWWSNPSNLPFELVRLLDSTAIPECSIAALLMVDGEYLDGQTFTGSESEELRSLFLSMIDLATATRSADLFPHLDPFLLWRSPDNTLCALASLDKPPTSEAEAVRYVAQKFYGLVTGINLQASRSQVPMLSQWCRFAGQELSRIVGSCLSPEKGKGTINTFAQLSAELGRSQTDDVTVPWTSEANPALQQEGHFGLAKVAGMHQLKDLLRREVVEPVRNPEPFKRYGLAIPNGILLYGPPGCGKTYIARALAEELGHYFAEIIPSELASPYVHGSVIRIRELFDDAAEHAPAIVFIDEFEALVPIRTSLGGFQHHKAEEVNEILTHLNGASERRVFIIAATNQPEMIDPAVRRTGRLDKLIYVGAPDVEARREMLILHLAGRPLSDELDPEQLAEALAGYSASDLRFLVDEAAREALLSNMPISTEAFNQAMARITPSIPPELELQYQSIEQRGL